jgi:hypothetical protein
MATRFRVLEALFGDRGRDCEIEIVAIAGLITC